MAVQLFFLENITLSNRNKLKTFLLHLFKQEKKELKSLNYIFCSDEYLLNINRVFLKHDYYTDIITFDLSEKEKNIKGEIYISIDRIKENANLLDRTIREELHRVIFHGALHLCGYKDKSKSDKSKMREKEDYYLHKYFK